MNNPKFKAGQILVLKKNNQIVKWGWNKNMVIRIDKVNYGHLILGPYYNFTHITNSAPEYPKNKGDQWSLEIIDHNFEIGNKALQILYGDKNDKKNDKK